MLLAFFHAGTGQKTIQHKYSDISWDQSVVLSPSTAINSDAKNYCCYGGWGTSLTSTTISNVSVKRKDYSCEGTGRVCVTKSHKALNSARTMTEDIVHMLQHILMLYKSRLKNRISEGCSTFNGSSVNNILLRIKCQTLSAFHFEHATSHGLRMTNPKQTQMANHQADVWSNVSNSV